ncbi:MAG: RDD family protein [Actinomycetota bacterium]
MEHRDVTEPFGDGFWAGTIDGLVFLPVGFADNYLLSADRAAATILVWGTVSYSVYWVYSVLLHARYGQTLGKMVAGVKVLDLSEEHVPSLRQALIRDFPHIVVSVASLVYLYVLVVVGKYSREAEIGGPGLVIGIASMIWVLLELVTMLASERRRAIHDLLAGTVVVRDDQRWTE